MIYRVSSEAERDLESIWIYTADRWGNEQADGYIDAMIARFLARPQQTALAGQTGRSGGGVRLSRAESRHLFPALGRWHRDPARAASPHGLPAPPLRAAPTLRNWASVFTRCDFPRLARMRSWRLICTSSRSPASTASRLVLRPASCWASAISWSSITILVRMSPPGRCVVVNARIHNASRCLDVRRLAVAVANRTIRGP